MEFGGVLQFVFVYDSTFEQLHERELKVASCIVSGLSRGDE